MLLLIPLLLHMLLFWTRSDFSSIRLLSSLPIISLVCAHGNAHGNPIASGRNMDSVYKHTLSYIICGIFFNSAINKPNYKSLSCSLFFLCSIWTTSKISTLDHYFDTWSGHFYFIQIFFNHIWDYELIWFDVESTCVYFAKFLIYIKLSTFHWLIIRSSLCRTYGYKLYHYKLS